MPLSLETPSMPFKVMSLSVLIEFNLIFFVVFGPRLFSSKHLAKRFLNVADKLFGVKQDKVYCRQ